LYLFFLAGVDSLHVIEGKHYLFWLRKPDFPPRETIGTDMKATSVHASHWYIFFRVFLL